MWSKSRRCNVPKGACACARCPLPAPTIMRTTMSAQKAQKNHCKLTGGVTVATVLPFESTGSIDWSSYSRLLDYCAAPEGIIAVFVNGHAGEGATLSPAERAEVIARTRRHIGSKTL